MRIRKILTVILTIFIILSCFTNVVLADEENSYQIEYKDITVTYNGENIECKEQSPVIKGGRTMVPLRAVFERIGCEVNFENGVITAVRGDETVTLSIGSEKAQVVSGGIKKEHVLDAAPIIENNRTLVPVRFVAEALGCKINWNPNQKEVVIIDVSAWKKDIKDNAPAVDALLSAPFANLADNLVKNYSTFEFEYKLKNAEEKQPDADIKLRLTFNGQTQSKDGKKKMSYTVNVKFTGLKSYANQLKDKEQKQKLQKLADITKINLEFVLDEDYNAYVEIEGIKKITDALGLSKDMKNNEVLKIPLGEIMTEESGLPLGTILRTGSLWDGIEKAVNESNTMFTQTTKTINDIIVLLKESLRANETEIKTENGKTTYTIKEKTEKSDGTHPDCSIKLTVKDNEISKCELKASSEYTQISDESGEIYYKWSADISSSKSNAKQSEIKIPSEFVKLDELMYEE